MMREKGVESPFVSFTELLTGTFLILTIIIVFLALNQGLSNADSLELKIGELQQEVGDLESRRDSLKLIVGELDVEVTNRTKENDSLRIAVQELENTYSQENGKREILQSQIEDIVIQLNQRSEELRRYGEEGARLTDLRARENELLTQVRELKILIGSLTRELDAQKLEGEKLAQLVIVRDGALEALGAQFRLAQLALQDAQRDNAKIAYEAADQIRVAIKRRDKALTDRRMQFLKTVERDLIGMGVQVRVEDTSLVLSDDILFAHDSAKIETRAQREAISRIANVLEAHLGCNIFGRGSAQCLSGQPEVSTVLIEGHADRSGDDKRNWHLSSERAYIVLENFLIKSGSLRGAKQGGVPQTDTQGLFAVAGYGESRNRLVTPDGVREPRNRRIELRFLFADEH